jgi:transcriptional regulator with XRE-family HTH domain
MSKTPVDVSSTAVMPTVRINVRQLMYEKTLRDKRYDNPITQEEVARAVGIAQGTMSSWVRGTVERLDRDTIAKFCHYFQCRIEQLLELRDD